VTAKRYRLPNGVEYATNGQGSAVTTFPDGDECGALSFYDDESVARARALGYLGTDREAVDAMTADHDLLHSLVALAIDGDESHALRYSTRGVQEKGRIPLEERLVFLLQRALNCGHAILDDYEADQQSDESIETMSERR
jgi:hypothetical protein